MCERVTPVSLVAWSAGASTAGPGGGVHAGQALGVGRVGAGGVSGRLTGSAAGVQRSLERQSSAGAVSAGSGALTGSVVGNGGTISSVAASATGLALGGAGGKVGLLADNDKISNVIYICWLFQGTGAASSTSDKGIRVNRIHFCGNSGRISALAIIPHFATFLITSG